MKTDIEICLDRSAVGATAFTHATALRLHLSPWLVHTMAVALWVLLAACGGGSSRRKWLSSGPARICHARQPGPPAWTLTFCHKRTTHEHP